MHCPVTHVSLESCPVTHLFELCDTFPSDKDWQVQAGRYFSFRRDVCNENPLKASSSKKLHFEKKLEGVQVIWLITEGTKIPVNLTWG